MIVSLLVGPLMIALPLRNLLMETELVLNTKPVGCVRAYTKESYKLHHNGRDPAEDGVRPSTVNLPEGQGGAAFQGYRVSELHLALFFA